MHSGISRLFSLALVFGLAFLAVFSLRVCSSGGGLARLWPDFGRSAGEFRPEPYTLPDSAPLKLDDTELLSRLNNEYARLTAAVVPSVVSIDTLGMRTERMMDGWGRTRVRRYPTQGLGSGVIVTKEGHAITNHHVIAGQQQIQVTLHDGKTYPATLIGEDPLLDLAVLKIEANQQFVPLKLGDSSQVRVGDLVFAIGNPFGLGETVTQGIISAKERSLSDTQRDLFQTDAAINPGNSGGPLVNIRGEIIAINVAIYSRDRENPGFQGVGFSIPSNDVREALAQILERGRPVRGYLGVQMRDLEPAIRAAINYNGESGAVVMATVADSPAERAGLRPWDVILAFGDQPVRSTSQFIALVQRAKVGETVHLKVWRRGENLTLTAHIIDSAASQAAAERPEADREADAERVLERIGVVARDLSMQEILRNFRGAVVTEVAPGSLAEGILAPGDVIVAVNGAQIKSANELNIHLAASAAVQATRLQLIRRGRSATATLPMVAPNQ
ncbi:MAG: trypsin-like peptidase domain-containing protein [Akkermansiaceae bacterium]|nr:trypsin-like peptidase domain-containing protein [Akkermansiaceae bacterium]